MSHADGNSTEGESIGGRNPAQTGTGCYRNFDHIPNQHQRSNSSTMPCLPTSEEPVVNSPSQRKLLELGIAEEQQFQYNPLALLSPAVPSVPDETQIVTSTTKEWISPSADSKKSEMLKKIEKLDEIPSEFECCYCATKELKEFVDAENLMSMSTSDFHIPVCLEMKLLKTSEQTTDAFALPEQDSEKKKNIYNGDLISVDSSDTFASCTTHPFNSEGDLTSDLVDTTCVIDTNLYINPLHKSAENSPIIPVVPGKTHNIVKKSASGDTALRTLATSPTEEEFNNFGIIERGSRVSLNDSPLPKHRKTRFQGNQPRTRFGNSFEFNSQESLEKKKKALISTRSLSSATRIINQHLFGLQNLSGSRQGKSNGSKSSLSADSLDSRTSLQLESNRRSKSILKKSDSTGNKNTDPESERLISDNNSGFEIGIENDYSPNKRFSPLLKQQSLNHKPISKHMPIYQQDLERQRTLKSQLFLLDYINNKDTASDDNKIQCSDNLSHLPLYICPPPPPMDNSPSEETQLLHSTLIKPRRRDSLSKRHNVPS